MSEPDHGNIIQPIHKALVDALDERDELEQRIEKLEDTMEILVQKLDEGK